MFTFATPSPTGTSCQAHFYTWTQLSEFSDFLHYCALLLSARTDPVHTEQRSKALRQLKTSYKDDEWEAFHQSFIELCGTFSRNIGYGIYKDLFAVPFTQIGAASRTLKQDFTPADVGKLIGAISIPSKLLLPEEGFFSLGDQACGSGTLLLAGVQRFVDIGYNPTAQLVIQAADLDAHCVHMAYLNLSLYCIPAVIVQGNTINLKEYDRWYTPAYLWGKWIWRAPMPFGESGYVSDEMLACACHTGPCPAGIYPVWASGAKIRLPGGEYLPLPRAEAYPPGPAAGNCYLCDWRCPAALEPCQIPEGRSHSVWPHMPAGRFAVVAE